MGFYFRKSIGRGPFRLTFSKSGISSSFGVKGARITAGPRGTYITVGAHGVYYRERVDRLDRPGPHTSTLPSPPLEERRFSEDSLHPEFKVPLSALQDTNGDEVLRKLNEDVRAFDATIVVGLIFGIALICILTVFPNVILFALSSGIGTYLTIRAHQRFVADHSNILSYDLDDAARQRFDQVSAGVQALAGCQRLWRIDMKISTADWKHNAGASALMNRKLIAAGRIPLPRLVSSNLQILGLDLYYARLYFFPEHILVLSSGKLGKIPYSELRLSSNPTRFIEEETVPSDASRVGGTWRFVNKNGSPDRRFNNNRQLPIMQYGQIDLATASGIQAILHGSNVQLCSEFCTAFVQARQANKGAPAPAPAEAKQVLQPAPPELSEFGKACQVLGIKPPITAATAAAAYHKAAALYHPDKVANLGSELQRLAETKMREINAAYEVVKATVAG